MTYNNFRIIQVSCSEHVTIDIYILSFLHLVLFFLLGRDIGNENEYACIH